LIWWLVEGLSRRTPVLVSIQLNISKGKIELMCCILVWTFADELGCEIEVSNQIGWGFGKSKTSQRGKK